MEVPHDGCCLARALRVALGLDASDSDVAEFRKSLADCERKYADTFNVLILEEPFDPKDEDHAKRLKAHYEGVQTKGIFLKSSEIQAAAELLSAKITVDIVQLKVRRTSACGTVRSMPFDTARRQRWLTSSILMTCASLFVRIFFKPDGQL